MISRNLATPLAAIGLILMATTGLGMFFELATEPTKTLHEWGGWLFVAGAALHVSSNLESFKRHVAKPLVAGLLVLTFAIAMTSFFIGDREKHDEHGDHDRHQTMGEQGEPGELGEKAEE